MSITYEDLAGSDTDDYRRRSSDESDDKQIYSLEDQARCNEQNAKRFKLKINKTFQESKSAKIRGKRAVFNELLERTRQGKTKVWLTWHANRIARNVVEGGMVVELMDEGKLLAIVTNSRIYFNTPDDKWSLMVEFSNSKKFSDDLSQAVYRGMEGKFKRGGWPNKAKLGYLNKRNDQDERWVEVDPIRFPLLRRAIDLYLTGAYSAVEVLKKLNDEWGFRTKKSKRIGGTKLSLSSFYYFLRDPYYYGKRQWNGLEGEYEKKLPRLMTEAEYWRIQQLLDKRGVPRPHIYNEVLYRNIIKCGECESKVIPYVKQKTLKDGSVSTYVYAKCNNKGDHYKCHQPQVSIADFDNQILQILESIRISDDFFHWAIKALRETNIQETEQNRNYQETLSVDLIKQQQRLSALLDMRLDLDVDKEEFENKKKEIKKSISELELKIRFHNNRIENWIDTAERCFEFARDAKDAFQFGDSKTKMTILQAMGSNFILRDKKLFIGLKKPFAILKDNDLDVKGEMESIELEEYVIVGAKESFSTQETKWWTVAESNR